MVACSGRVMVKHAGIKLHLMQCHSFSCILFNLIFLSFSKTKSRKAENAFLFCFYGKCDILLN
nr:MAG TPA: hypothetical protein [Caudoviricetes sp.]